MRPVRGDGPTERCPFYEHTEAQRARENDRLANTKPGVPLLSLLLGAAGSTQRLVTVRRGSFLTAFYSSAAPAPRVCTCPKLSHGIFNVVAGF